MRTEWTIEMYSDWSLSLFVRVLVADVIARRLLAVVAAYMTNESCSNVCNGIFCAFWMHVLCIFFSRIRFVGLYWGMRCVVSQNDVANCVRVRRVHLIFIALGSEERTLMLYLQAKCQWRKFTRKYSREIFILNCTWRRIYHFNASSLQQYILHTAAVCSLRKIKYIWHCIFISFVLHLWAFAFCV